MGRLRATMIGVRVTAAERVLLEGAAEADGLPLATLLRRVALRAARRARQRDVERTARIQRQRPDDQAS